MRETGASSIALPMWMMGRPDCLENDDANRPWNGLMQTSGQLTSILWQGGCRFRRYLIQMCVLSGLAIQLTAAIYRILQFDNENKPRIISYVAEGRELTELVESRASNSSAVWEKISKFASESLDMISAPALRRKCNPCHIHHPNSRT